MGMSIAFTPPVTLQLSVMDSGQHRHDELTNANCFRIEADIALRQWFPRLLQLRSCESMDFAFFYFGHCLSLGSMTVEKAVPVDATQTVGSLVKASASSHWISPKWLVRPPRHRWSGAPFRNRTNMP